MRLCAAVIILPWLHAGQALLPEAEWNALRNEISGDRAWHWTNRIAEFDRNIGSEGYVEAMRYVEAELRKAGVSRIRTVDLPYGQPSWTGVEGELWITSPHERKIASWGDSGTAIAINSRNADLTAALIDAGSGDTPADFAGKDVAGKIVLACGRLDRVYPLAVFHHGAAGVISCAPRWPGAVWEFPDHIGWQSIPAQGGNGREPTWAFSVSYRTAEELRALLLSGRSVQARVKIETRIRTPGTMQILMATIPGRSKQNEAIVYTAHLDHMRGGANDDASGCGNLIEMARALTRLIREGKIRPPDRDIQFWFTPEVVGEYAYFAKFPEERKKILININQEMVGEDQTRLGSAAIFERAPWSLPTWLNDVMRHYVEHVIETNTGTINQHERFSDPLFSALGSRDRFFSFLVPFYPTSDHETFVFGPIGIPAVHATCFPDYNLHTNRDTIVNVDATQLRRIALIFAATGYFASAAGTDSVPSLVNEVSAGSHALLARMAGIAGRRTGECADARSVVAETARYGAACIRSAAHFGASPLAEAAARRFEQAGKLAVDQISEACPARDAGPTGAAEIRPRWSAPLARIIDARPRIQLADPRPSNALLFEIDSLIDGRRTALDIFRVAQAESWFGGSPYYGPVTLDQVTRRMSALRDAGLVAFER
ncbi:MAG: M28 family peptidase [Acidobacteria bacterium]|nr:M28 family peptidase [Acidobacteriota bacterium]